MEMLDGFIPVELYGSHRRVDGILSISRYAHDCGGTHAFLCWRSDLSDLSGHSSHVQIEKELDPCPWSQLRFSGWDDWRETFGLG